MNRAQAFDYHLVLILIVTALAIGGLVLIFHTSGSSSSSSGPSVWNNDAPTKGSAHPTMRLTEFGDFQCPTCKAYAPIIDHLLSLHSDLAVQYRYFPLEDIHHNAFEAAVAAQFAHQQKHFWQMHDLLYSNQDSWASLPDPHTSFTQFLVLLGLDEKPYQSKIGWDQATKVVNEDLALAQKMQLTGTPSFFINGTLFTDDLSEPNLEKSINAVSSKP